MTGGSGLGAADGGVRLGPLSAAPSPSRICAICGRSLAGKRRHARYCGSSCRAEANRRRRQPPSWTFWSGGWGEGEEALSAVTRTAQRIPITSPRPKKTGGTAQTARPRQRRS